MNPDDAIYLLKEDRTLTALEVVPYEAEKILQDLLSEHPQLLGGSQINPEDPVRWLHIRAEAGISDSEGGGGRWALDHLLIDQHGTPTLVEVKRSTDTRIRREVVGQMMDYAANAQAHWPSGHIRALAADQHDGEEGLREEIAQLVQGEPWAQGLEPDAVVEAFWREVDRKLKDGELRLLFVADRLPRELRRIIEFLNEQMQRVEVLGVEVPQYRSGAMTALVPRVIGQTEAARSAKTTSTTAGRSRTNAETLLAEAQPGSRPFLKALMGFAKAQGLELGWGKLGFSVRKSLPDGRRLSLAYAYPRGWTSHDCFEFYLGHIEDDALRERLKTQVLALGPFELRGKRTLRMNTEVDGDRCQEIALAELGRWAAQVAGEAREG